MDHPLTQPFPARNDFLEARPFIEDDADAGELLIRIDLPFAAYRPSTAFDLASERRVGKAGALVANAGRLGERLRIPDACDFGQVYRQIQIRGSERQCDGTPELQRVGEQCLIDVNL